MAKKQQKKEMENKKQKSKVKECKDINCPIHGSLKVRGRTFKGKVIKSKMKKTVSVEWKTKNYFPKYERYLINTSRVKAHLPECIEVDVGDEVKIRECRPLSKTKKFVVVSKDNESSKSKSK